LSGLYDLRRLILLIKVLMEFFKYKIIPVIWQESTNIRDSKGTGIIIPLRFDEVDRLTDRLSPFRIVQATRLISAQIAEGWTF
jgi:hypothetical protein